MDYFCTWTNKNKLNLANLFHDELSASLLYDYSHKFSRTYTVIYNLLIYIGLQGFDDSYEQTDIGTLFSIVCFNIKFPIII